MKCKYHPLEAAINHCETCCADYCEACSDESAASDPRRTRADKTDHSCFVCKTNLSPLSGASNIPPFWTRLPEIYRYPLNTQAIIALLVVSFATAFIGNSIILFIIPLVAMIMYSFTCLRETAKGNLKAPGLEACFEGSIAPLAYVVIVVVILVLGAYNIFKYVGNGLGIIVSAVCILALPAIIIIIAIEERLLPAMNPSGWFSVMRSTGTAYFVMLLFMLIMTFSVFALTSAFGAQSDSFLGIFFQSLVSNYYGVVTYYIMGYLVYQNQEALGFITKDNRRTSDLRPESVRQKVELELLIKSGDYSAAADVARKQLDHSGATLWDWSRAFTLVCVSSSNGQSKAMFDQYANKLDTAGELDKLASAYLLIKNHQPKFIIDDHQRRLLVAKSLFDIGQYSQVANMLHMFHQESKDNTLVTRALKLLSDSLLSIPGREKLANQYKTLYQLQLQKA